MKQKKMYLVKATINGRRILSDPFPSRQKALAYARETRKYYRRSFARVISRKQ